MAVVIVHIASLFVFISDYLLSLDSHHSCSCNVILRREIEINLKLCCVLEVEVTVKKQAIVLKVGVEAI
jgi:hypothetical protein